MAFFLLLCTDRPDARELRAATRPAHLAYLEGEGGRVKLGGAWLDDAGAPLGSMLVIEMHDMAQAAAFAAADPYAKAGVFADTRILPWRLAVGGFA